MTADMDKLSVGVKKLGLHLNSRQLEQFQTYYQEPIDWNQRDAKILHFYQQLILLRKKHPALSSRTTEAIPNNQPAKIISYIKKEGKEQILVVLNLSKNGAEVSLDLPDKYINLKFTDLFNDHQSIPGHNLQSLKMEPYGYYLLKAE